MKRKGISRDVCEMSDMTQDEDQVAKRNTGIIIGSLCYVIIVNEIVL